ncbi:MAG: CehA/McbA family metallohydrolase [bacterium]
MKPWGVIFALALASCSSDSNPSPAKDMGSDVTTSQDVGLDAPSGPPVLGERPIAGQWWTGDFHVHASGASNDTGGDSTPAAIKARALEIGLDFVVLTDHSNSTGSDTTTTVEDETLFNMGPEFPYWDEAAALSDANFLMIDGNEMSPTDDGLGYKPRGHIGCYPRDLATFDPDIAFVDRPRGVVSGAQTIEQARAAGCFVTVNHPFGPASWIAFDWTTRDYDAMEVYNGSAGWDFFDSQAIEGLKCDLALGKDTRVLAGSDNHRVNIVYPGTVTNPPLGFPKTRVWAESLDWSQLLAGVDAGHISISDNDVPFEFDLFDTSGQWLGFGGDEVDASEVAWARLRGSSEGADKARTLKVVEVVPDGCVDNRSGDLKPAPVAQTNTVFEQAIEPGDAFEFVFAVQLKPNHAYLATLLPDAAQGSMRFGIGITNSVRAK